MEFDNVVASRKSVRDFLSKDVEDEKLMKILEASRWAPSWENHQSCQFIVVRDKAIIQKLCLFENVPVLLVACANPEESGQLNGMDYYLVDVGICTQQLVLAATNLGLGTCWTGFFNEEDTKKMLQVPENIKIVALILLGYPDPAGTIGKDLREMVKGDTRKPLEEMIHKEKW